MPWLLLLLIIISIIIIIIIIIILFSKTYTFSFQQLTLFDLIQLEVSKFKFPLDYTVIQFRSSCSLCFLELR